MYYVYVLKSASSARTYIGHTQDLKTRLDQHNSRLGKSAGTHSQWKVIHVETYATRALAMKRECYLKTGDGRKVLRLKGVL